MTLTARSRDGRFTVVLEAGVLDSLYRLCAEAQPLETGGILTGYYMADGSTVVVTAAEPPPEDSRRRPRRFDRGTKGLAARIAALWSRPAEDRRYYVGEWHLHPLGAAVPSAQDRKEMARIAGSLAECRKPVLVVVGGGVGAWEVGVWVYPRGEEGVELVESEAGRPQ